MSLRIITGRAGSGKSHKISEEITEYLKQEKRGPAFLIVPEQFMINAERRLLDSPDCPGLMEDEVLSFKRLAYMVFKKKGVGTKPVADGIADVLYMIKTVEEVHDDLKYYGEICGSVIFITGMISQIREFERYLITPEMLKNLKKGDKFEDLALIYDRFRKNITENYAESTDDGALLTDILSKENYFTGAHIWIDEFHGFTGREYKIIENLVKQAEEVTICLSADEKDPVFENNMRTLSKLEKTATHCGGFTRERLSENYRHTGKEDLKYLEKIYYTYPYKKYEAVPEHIHISEFKTRFDEAESCARRILKAVSEENMTYRDIAVMISDNEGYGKIVENIFSGYGIPFFMDSKKDLSGHIYAKYLMLLLKTAAEGWKSETVFDILRTGFYEESEDDIDYLELYFKKTGAKGKNAFKRQTDSFIFREMKQHGGEKARDEADAVREKICSELEEFEKVTKNSVTVGDYCKNIAEYLKKHGIKEKIEERATLAEQEGEIRVSEELVRGYEGVNDVILKIYNVLGEKKLPDDISQKAETMIYYLEAGMTQCKIGYIPVTDNCVQVGTKERTRSHEIKRLYVLGANDGILPKEIGGYGIISNEDRELMEREGMETAGDDRQMAVAEQFNIYSMLTLPEDELFISYSLCDMSNKKTEPSQVVDRIMSVFPNIVTVKEKKRKESENGYHNLEENPVFEKGDTKELYLKDDTISSSFSAISSYETCPYRYYLENVLRLVTEDDSLIDPGTYGSAMHEVLEKAVREAVKEKGRDVVSITPEECEKYAGEAADEICPMKFGKTKDKNELSNKIAFIIERLKESAAVCMKESLSQGVPEEFERKFGKDGSRNDIETDVSGENKNITVSLSGIIDRIDCFDILNTKTVNVIDYKSKMSKETDKEHEMQLTVYMNYILGETEKAGGEAAAGKMINAFYDSGSKERVKVYEFDEKKVQEFNHKAALFAENLRDCNFSSENVSTQKCSNCNFAIICRKMRKKAGK